MRAPRPHISWFPANSRPFAADARSGERRRQVMRPIIVMLALAGVSAGQGGRAFTGVITDSECSNADHAHMRMGPTDAECVSACISEHGGSYILFDGKNVYALSDQKTPEKFAARKVTITGTLDAKGKTIQVDSIRSAK